MVWKSGAGMGRVWCEEGEERDDKEGHGIKKGGMEEGGMEGYRWA